MLINFNTKPYTIIYPFLTAFVVYVLVYGFELSHFSLSIDEEFNDNIMHTISMGRWGHAYLKLIFFPEPFIPFFTEIISFILLSVTCCVITNSLNLNLKEAIFFSILFASMPQLAYQLQFLNQFDTLAASLFLASFSINLMIKRKGIFFAIILPSSLLCFSISIYQSVIFFPLSILISFFCIETVRSEKNLNHFKIIIRFIISSIIGFVLYAILTRMIQNYYQVSSDSYFINMINWLHFPPTESLKIVINLISSYFTFKAPYGLSIFTFSAVFLIAPLILPVNRIRYSLYALMLIFSAFAMNMIIGGVLPARAMTSLTVVFASSGTLAFITLKKWKLLWLVPSVSLIYGTAVASNLFYTDYISYNKDYRLAVKITNDISEKFKITLEDPTKVYFYGGLNMNYNNKPVNSDMFGTSFLNWDSGNSARISAFINRTGIANITPASYNNIKKSEDLIKSAPIWPSNGSIFIVSDVIIVKLGQNPGNCINGTYKNIDPTRCL